MLLIQKAWVESGRAFAYWIALQVDQSLVDPSPLARLQAADLVALLTPVLKAFVTDNGYQCATLGQQVLGGLGYLKQSGASLFVADARVGQIYEGANGIQGIDLLGRKVLADGGKRLDLLLSLVNKSCDSVTNDVALQAMAARTRELVVLLRDETTHLVQRHVQDPQLVGACAHSYLRLIGHLVNAWFWLRMSKVAGGAAAQTSFHRGKVQTARFYFDHLYPEIYHLAAVIRAPSGAVMDLPAEDF